MRDVRNALEYDMPASSFTATDVAPAPTRAERQQDRLSSLLWSLPSQHQDRRE
jgi:hypothetical protein